MGLSFLRSCVCVCFVFAASMAYGAEYEITDTRDAVENDGVCTLREAVQAASTGTPVNECEEGDTSNTIRLLEAATFSLTGGMLEFGGSGGNPNLTIEVIRDGPFDETERENPVIAQTSSTERVFYIHSGSSLAIKNVTLQGGDVSGAQQGLASDPDDDGLGGQVYARGGFLLSDGAILDGGSADEGGAIYLSGAPFRATDARVENHTSGGNGGAVAMDDTVTGLLLLERVYFGGNTATAGDGGAIHLDGASASITLVNSTFYNNTAVNGGAIDQSHR